MFLKKEHADDLLGSSDMELVQSQIKTRRSALENQAIAGEIRIGLCDELQARRRNLGIDADIRGFEESNPSLYEYIKTLEFVQKNIWCPQCNCIAVTPSPAEVASYIEDTQIAIANKYKSALEDLKDVDEVLDAMVDASEKLAEKLAKISAVVGDLAV